LGAPDQGPYPINASWPGEKAVSELIGSAEQALKERVALIIQRKARDESRNAREWYEVAYPILITARLYGAVVLKVTPRPPAALEAVLQQLCWGMAWLEVMLHRRHAIESVIHNERLHSLLDTLATLVERDGFHAGATAFVTDLAGRLACERVSLGFRDGDRVRLEAISHSARFAQRANLSRAIEAAMDEVFDQETLVLFPPASAQSTQIIRCHQDLARHQGSSSICSVPLGRDGEIYGVLTFERLADYPFDSAAVEFCEAIAALAGPILELKMRDEHPLTRRATETLGKRIDLLIGPGHIAAKLAGVLITALVIFFSVVKGPYRVSAKTFIEAQSQRVAVAPFNGYIAAARVRPGDLVRAGEILATLDNRDLKLEQLKWSSQKEQYSKQYSVAMAERNAAHVKIAAAQVAQAEAELALVEDQLARTHLRAPIEGVVISGDLSQSIGAPAERGQVLFEVAPLDAYRVVLQVDEREAAEIAVGQRGKIALSAFPSRPFSFVVRKITPVSAAREGRNYFRVEAALDQAPAQLRPGMEGVGKIEVAQRRLIWIWTHRALDWLRLFVWSWLP
jgi:RND family efflux transporter MFP subunit